MFQGFASTAFVVGTLLTLSIPAAGLARDRGGYGGSYGRSYSGGSHYNGRQSYVSPRAYSGGRPGYYSRGYVAPRYYARPGYRGYYRGGVYLGFGAPYGYAYGPGYYYDPGYAYGPSYGYDPGYSYGQAPSPQPYGQAPSPQPCAEGSYDQNGNWVANPNCYPNQQQYDPNQPQQYERR